MWPLTPAECFILLVKSTCELFGYTFEEFLNGGAVTDEGGGHFETTWWDITHSDLDIVGDPFDEVAAVLVLDVQHLFVDLWKYKMYAFKNLIVCRLTYSNCRKNEG